MVCFAFVQCHAGRSVLVGGSVDSPCALCVGMRCVL